MVEINNDLPQDIINNLNKYSYGRKDNSQDNNSHNSKIYMNDNIINYNNNYHKENYNSEINKLRAIMNNINKKLNEGNNMNKDLEEIYKDYIKNEYEKNFKNGMSDCYIIFMLVIGAIYVIINLTGIFTIKSVMDALFKTFKVSLKNFLYKKSYLDKYKLTDYKNRFLSSYNFYEIFFKSISSNDIDLDLIMFWDFIGLFLQKYCGITCTSIICLILSSILLVLISAFDYLDIDNNTHKYLFSQILYLFFVYLFLWIIVGSCALLSQNIFIESLSKYLKKKQIEALEKAKKNIIEKETSKIKINEKIEKEFKILIEDDRNNILFFPILLLTIFLPFLINHITNRKIFEYLKNYYFLKKVNNMYEKIYSKEKFIFIICVCIPYFGEIFISLLFYFAFKTIYEYNSGEQEKSDIINNEVVNKLKIKKVSIKKICGYTILYETISENRKEENKKIGLTKKCCKCCCYNCKLLIKTFIDCFKNTICCCFCYKEYDPYDNSCCCCKSTSLEPKEKSFCLCYQEKGKFEWIRDSFNNETQRKIISFMYIILFCQITTLGFEVIYQEKSVQNKINKIQENILIPLLISFAVVFFIFFLLFLIYIKKRFKDIDCCRCSNNFETLMMIVILGLSMIEFITSILSFIFSINYLKDKNAILKGNLIYYPFYINKFTIFFIYFFCLKHDEKNQMISHSSFASIYLYIVQLILYGIKKIFHLKGLIILQIVFSSILIPILFIINCCSVLGILIG